MTRQNRLKCRNQLEAAESSKNTHTLIKEQARVIHGEEANEAKVQPGAEAESKNSPEIKNHKQNLQAGQGKSRVKIQNPGKRSINTGKSNTRKDGERAR